MASSSSAGPSRAPSVSGEETTKHSVYGPTGHIEFVDEPQRSYRRSSSSLDKAAAPKCQFADDFHVVCYSDLFTPPLIRQWMKDGRLYREREERSPSRFELFFDLLLVGVVHQLAEKSSENVSGLGVAKVTLAFYPAYSIWTDLRNWLNQSGVDDVSQRVHTLIIMVCLIGYSANASAIELGRLSEDSSSDPLDGTTEPVARLVRRAVHVSPSKALVCAMGFFLFAKLMRLIVLARYAVALPDFRFAHIMRGIGHLVVSVFFLGIIFTSSTISAAILAAVGILVDILGRLSVGIAVLIERRKLRRQKLAESTQLSEIDVEKIADVDPSTHHAHLSSVMGLEKNRMLPATNIEHLIERNAGLVTVVLGESVVSLLYVASQGSFGLSKEFARATFALVVAFVFNSLYFDTLSKKYVHAIRRHWITHIFWDFLHYPLCLALILASAASSLVVVNTEVPQAVRWQYGASLGVALICIAACHMLHQSADHKGAQKLSQNGRAATRIAFAIIFILLPLIKHIGDTQFICTYAGLSGLLVIIEIWAKLGTEVKESVDHTIVDAEAQDEIEEVVEETKRAASAALAVTGQGGGGSNSLLHP